MRDTATMSANTISSATSSPSEICQRSVISPPSVTRGIPADRAIGTCLDETSLVRPTRQLVPRRELELAQDARNVCLHRLHGQVQACGDLLVAVPASDELEHLAL